MQSLFERTGRDDYYWSNTEETHCTRTRAMLKKYGDKIRKLYGPDPWLRFLVPPIAFLQMYLGYRAADMSWTTFLILAYFIGGTITHSMFLAIHEITHNLAFETPILNDIYAIFANLIIPVPYAMMFKTYHAEHHHYLGWEAIDADVPTVLEGKLLSSYIGKFFFITFQVFFYAFRPCIIRSIKFEKLHVLNYVIQITFDLLIYKTFGVWPLLFFLCSVFLGTGWHPLAGHFISEHFVMAGDGKQETFSYYGPLNWLTWNVGYHVEHHDFPTIPWTRIHKLREIAPEFYDGLLSTKSWPGALFEFLLNPEVSLCSRVVREKGASKREKLLPTFTEPMETALPYMKKKES